MKKISFKLWLLKIQQVAKRFPSTLFFVLGLAFLFLLQINDSKVDIQPHTWTFFSLGIIVSLAVSLFAEEYKDNKFFWILVNLVSFLILFGYCYTLPENLETVNFLQIIAIGVSFILASFFTSFLKKNNDISFWEFSKTSVVQLVIAFVFSQVLMLGLSLAVLSLRELFHIEIKDLVFQYLAVICYAIFAPIYFLTNVPDGTEKHKEEFQFASFLKILGLYILLPILLLYTVILYVYLLQILGKWELPNGWVSTLVSVLGLGGFITMFILFPLRHENTNKWLASFYKLFPLILLPLLVLMSIGILRRFYDYGITINRSYVLVLNIWLIAISVYLFLSKSNHLKWIVITFAGVLFFASVGSWSVYRVTESKLISQLYTLFANADMLENGKIPTQIKDNSRIDSISQHKMVETIRYLSSNYGNKSLQPFFKDSIEDISVSSILNKLDVKYESVHVEQDFFSAFLPLGYFLDIRAYDYVLEMKYFGNNSTVYKDESKNVVLENNVIILHYDDLKSTDISIALESKLNELNALAQKSQKHTYNLEEMTIDGENYKLLIKNMSAQYSKEESSFVITGFNAQLYYKIK